MNEVLIATGPESTGKTTLCTRLAKETVLSLVSEAARGYLEARNRLYQNYQYTENDLLNIAMIQYAAESLTFEKEKPPLICDTDLLTIIIWSEEKFGRVNPWISQTFQTQCSQANRHYFLCHWDIPWQPDPLRENPDDRHRLYTLYEAKLKQLELPYTILTGGDDQRLTIAKTATHIS